MPIADHDLSDLAAAARSLAHHVEALAAHPGQPTPDAIVAAARADLERCSAAYSRALAAASLAVP